MTNACTTANLSYLNPDVPEPWASFLEQIDRVSPHLGALSRWTETLKRPKRTMIVDVPIVRDDGTNEQTMAWMMDTYSINVGGTATGVVTGKPVALGGSLGRHEATGRGVFIAAREAGRRRNVPIDGARVAAQGFGNVGGMVARMFAMAGAKVVALQDHSTTLVNEAGIDVSKAFDHVVRHGQLLGFMPRVEVSAEDFWHVSTEFLIPAALEGQLLPNRARKVKTRIVVESANGPTTPAAEDILADRGILVVPDVLANAGGVTVSYFEWVQDFSSFFWTEDGWRLRFHLGGRGGTGSATAHRRIHRRLRTRAFCKRATRPLSLTHYARLAHPRRTRKLCTMTQQFRKTRFRLHHSGVDLEVSALQRDGDRTPFVFLHGFGSTKEDYADFVRQRAFDGHRFLAFDAAGCGETLSSELSRTSIPFLVETALRVLDAVKFDRFHLVGHSMGGLAGLMLAHQYPERVISFVDIKGNLAPEDCFLSRQILDYPETDVDDFWENFIARTHAAPAFSNALYAASLRHKVRARAVRPIFESMVDLSDNGDLISKLLGLPCPKMFMYGEEFATLSYLGHIQSNGVHLAEIEDCGHFPMYSNPTAMWKEIANFVA
ncbi:Glutamate dehydrogenase/leucine dehydrogenase [Ensifer sp. YR511]|nr:Glutamate dehydrogenase/leucine dehydrogenase [Ensifer sp. YR511]